MSDTTLRNKIGIALVVLAAVLYVAPALFPVQPHLTHDTRRSVVENESELEAEGHRILEYENLSARGKELYRKTLRNDGEYTVSLGEGAPEFAYPTERELDRAEDRREFRLQSVVIERPPDADLPPADEPVEQIREERREEEREAEEPPEGEPEPQFPNATVVARYDMMETRTEDPPLGAPAALGRLAATLLGVLSLGVGGYVLSTK